MNDVIAEIENLRTDIEDIKKIMLKGFRDLEGQLSDIEDTLKRMRR